MSSLIVYNTAALDRLLKGRDGPVARTLLTRAVRVESQAKVLCPFDTGRLRGSITHELGIDGAGLYADIGTNVEYALFVHEGTSRMRARPFLRNALPAAM